MVFLSSFLPPMYDSYFDASIFIFWLLAGVILIGIEFFYTKRLGKKYQYILLLLGINALLLAIYNFRYKYVAGMNWQITYWMFLSLAAILWIRPMLLIKGKRNIVQDANEAQTIDDILPGKTGKVIYEGCLWQAKCEDRTITILANQTVYVMRREGNTLVIMPSDLFQI